MEDLTKLSKTELIQKLQEAEEKLKNYLESDGSNNSTLELENLKKEYTKLAIKYGKKTFELIVAEVQLQSLKDRNLWDRIWNI